MRLSFLDYHHSCERYSTSGTLVSTAESGNMQPESDECYVIVTLSKADASWDNSWINQISSSDSKPLTKRGQGI